MGFDQGNEGMVCELAGADLIDCGHVELRRGNRDQSGFTEQRALVKVLDLLAARKSYEIIADLAYDDDDILRDLLAGVAPNNKSAKWRYPCHQILIILSERYPDVLYKRWNYFIDLLKSNNTNAQMNANNE